MTLNTRLKHKEGLGQAVKDRGISFIDALELILKNSSLDPSQKDRIVKQFKDDWELCDTNRLNKKT